MYGIPLEKSAPDSVVLAQKFAKKMGCRPDPPVRIFRTLDGYPSENRPFKCVLPNLQLAYVTSTGQMSAIDLQVVGLIDAGYRDLDSRFLMMPLEQAQSLEGTQNISYVSVLLKSAEASADFVERLQKTSDNKGLQLKIQDWREHPVIGDTYRKTDDFLTVFKGFLSLVLLGIAGLSILNTFVRIVKERTREIGTWRSLGYTDRQMMWIFTVESLLLGLIGIAVGATLSIGLSFFINSLEIPFRAGLFAEPIPLAISYIFGDYLKTGFVLILVCILASTKATQGTLRKRIYENMID
ncbi:MAG: ABC transporter permease [Pseudobdellovibrionaceae bacterium]